MLPCPPVRWQKWLKNEESGASPIQLDTVDGSFRHHCGVDELILYDEVQITKNDRRN